MKRTRYPLKLQSQQRGFTIVEIMVAITLSMVLIGGVIQIYVSSKESFRVQNELARLQENQRIAIEFLQRDISQAGFVPYPNGPLPGADITVIDGGGTNPDTIRVQYSSAFDCLGARTPAGIAINTYTINPATQQLMCLGNVSPVPQPIADGVENMQVLWGDNVNTGNDPLTGPSADRYVNPAIAGVNVVSVRISLLVRSLQPVRKQATVQNFILLDNNIARNGRFKHQVITTTIPFRNPVKSANAANA